MPNWVTTKLDFSGKEQDIQKLFAFVKSDASGFDFRNIIPYPTREECPEKYLITDAEELDGYWHSPSKHLILSSKDDYLDWYNFSIDNWGTKWNASDVYVDEKTFSIEFQTAWSFCYPVLKKLSELFPDIFITASYADEDVYSNNVGQYEFIGGKGREITLDDPMGFAIRLQGREDDFELIDGEWREIDDEWGDIDE